MGCAIHKDCCCLSLLFSSFVIVICHCCYCLSLLFIIIHYCHCCPLLLLLLLSVIVVVIYYYHCCYCLSSIIVVVVLHHRCCRPSHHTSYCVSITLWHTLQRLLHSDTNKSWSIHLPVDEANLKLLEKCPETLSNQTQTQRNSENTITAKSAQDVLNSSSV